MSVADKADKPVAAKAMPSGTTSGTPQLLLGHHLKQLKLPTILREYDKVAREAAREGIDHASILKFIERNWRLPKISALSRDHLPNPIADRDDNVYRPVNAPAIGDMMKLFTFGDDDDEDRDNRRHRGDDGRRAR